MNRLPILNYHGIQKIEGDYSWAEAEQTYLLSLKAFKQQLNFLKEKRFDSLDLENLALWMRGDSKSSKPVVLTFDDGHKSHLEYAAPALMECGFKGIFFISAGLVGQGDLMNWNEIKWLSEQGFEMGSHGYYHRPLTSLNTSDLRQEVIGSKKMIEDKIGKEVKSFSVPRGFNSPAIRRLAQEAGYQFVFNSRFDLNDLGQDKFDLRRMAVKQSTSLEEFKLWLDDQLGWQRYKEAVKDYARSFIPGALYDQLACMKRSFAK